MPAKAFIPPDEKINTRWSFIKRVNEWLAYIVQENDLKSSLLVPKGHPIYTVPKISANMGFCTDLMRKDTANFDFGPISLRLGLVY